MLIHPTFLSHSRSIGTANSFKIEMFHFQLVLKRVGSPPINSYSTLNFLGKSTVLKWSFHLPTNPSITSLQSNELLLLFSRSLSSDSATPRTVTRQAPLSMRFPRQEYWSGLPFPSPGDLSNPGTQPASPALQADSLPLSHLGSPK